MLLLLLACHSPTTSVTDGPPPEATGDTGTASSPTDTEDPTVPASERYTDGTWTTTVEVDDVDTLARTYRFTTDHPQRDGGPQARTVTEQPDQPVLRSGSLLFDGLFALAVDDARLNAVDAITDGAFDQGTPQDCACYQTGELWPWVWTRDTAYATDLALAWLDPERARNSLQFKLSRRKDGGALRIVQDTGSGGSWPVSTDRAIWALGARAVLDTLPEPERSAFLAEAHEAVTTTALEDRQYVYDAADGLYRGEQSFLDWREQSYASATASNVVPIAESKALSTNLAHWILLDAAARWSDELGAPDPRYRDWADELAASIEAELLQGDRWATVKGPPLDPSTPDRRDWLGEALAALTIADPATAVATLSSYPHGPHGPPVFYPQQPGVPVYHNRAQWPFVTAYGLRAASRHRVEAVFQAGADELVRGAALNLSNMENAEWTTGEPWHDDGALSGPVVNSRRQLWSVAGYLSMVVDGLFGVRPGPDGLAFDPFVPGKLRQDWLADTVTLHRFPWHGDTVDLVLELPDGAGPFAGGTVSGFTLSPEPVAAAGGLTAADLAASTAPAEPPPPPVVGSTHSWPAGRYDVVRDGVVVATDVASPWSDSPAGDAAPCYALRASPPDSVDGPVACAWSEGRIQQHDAYAFTARGGSWSTDHGQPHYIDWGAPEHSLALSFYAGVAGRTAIQLVYANGAGPLNTGITASHKWATVTTADGTVVVEAPVVMPHTPGWDVYAESTLFEAELEADVAYTLTLTDAPNMSDLAAMASYTGGLGGGPAPYRYVDIAAVKLLGLDGPVVAAEPLAFDHTDDLDALPATQAVAPGVPLQPWSAFAFDWDDHYLYVVVVSEAFEDPFAPFVLYVEADPGAAAPSAGIAYSGQTPGLPFTPTHAIALRRQHDAGDGIGPWSGVWVPDGADWRPAFRFLEGRDVFTATDQHTLAAVVPRHLFGDATRLRLAGHVVYAVPGEEWKGTVPPTHTPWEATGGQDWLLDLDGPHPAAAWTLE